MDIILRLNRTRDRSRNCARLRGFIHDHEDDYYCIIIHMADESRTEKIPKGEEVQNSLSKDEIDQLSDMISDCMAAETLDTEQDAAKEDDTGEFKPVEGAD